jgi:hypothetical protein
LRSEGAASDGFSGVGEDASCLPWRSKIMSRVLRDCASVVGLVRFGGGGSGRALGAAGHAGCVWGRPCAFAAILGSGEGIEGACS